MNQLPLYHKLAIIIIGLFIFFYILYLGEAILVPLTFAWIFAILLNPVVNFLTRKKISRVISITLAVLLLLIVAGGVLFFIVEQASMFSDSWPQLKQKCSELAHNGLSWFSQKINISTVKIIKWIDQQKVSGIDDSRAVISTTLGTLSSMLIGFVLTPVYIFLFLYYKPLLLLFIAKLFDTDKHKIVADVLTQLKKLIQSYLVGLLIEMAIVATLNSVALLIIGIKYALLLGVIGAILNVIPYIGGIIAIALPMIMGVLNDHPISALYVLLAYTGIQLIDNHVLVPKIVASQVRVNALVSIVVVLIGGAIWGVAGMFLSIPLIAIAKVIFDRIESLEPYGFLIGDTMPRIGKSIFKFREKR